jgi:hypothetical protein
LRFLANGPSIPDELLVARDEGRVIFFCGAGVSRARARLADFFGLAKQVLDALESDGETPTRKLFEAAKRVEAETGISGLVPADRLFGLLERDFKVRDIQESVAKALRPDPTVDLSAHRTLLQLATGPDGKARLVTTNFDLLFEAAEPALNSLSPPKLPDPRRHDDLVGVTHLHGKVTPDYSGAANDGFVLSSSEFGHAYVSDGWATKFIASLLEKYVVVFVGYTADDPPVQYLLEALNRDAGSRGNLYAFQAGTSADADSRWRQRGVHPIAYDPADIHKALWDTLEAWAVRAQNPEAWYDTILKMAARGPEVLLPHERGQVVHLVETVDGARRFASAADLAPADWLCVFDPAARFSMPKRLKDVVDGPIVDPFELYGLDSDPRPAPVDADDFRARRAIPDGAKNPLLLTRLDRQDPGPNGMPAISGHWALNTPALADRLRHLGVWIRNVAHQPAAVWWAAGKRGLHTDIQQMIRFQLGRAGNPSSPEVRRAWRVMLEAWATKQDEANTPWFELKASIALDGWSPAAARQIASTHRPYLAVKRPFNGSPKPPGLENTNFDDMLVFDVEYPQIDIDIEIPDSMVLAVTREFRRNVEHGVALESETGGYALSQIAPIEADPGLEGASSQRNFELSKCVLFYAGLYKRLAELSPVAAKHEYNSWQEDDTVFARLRIWACTLAGVLTDEEAGKLLVGLPDSVFWNGTYQRDLLLSLQKRWGSMPQDSVATIEVRLLAGPPPAENDNGPDIAQRRAWFSLNRICWLHNQGCQFTFNFDAESARLRALAPKWQPEYAERAARSLESQAGYVRTDTAFDSLLSVPLADLITRARDLSGCSREGFVQDDPFAGLVDAQPVRAFRALVYSAKHQVYPDWAWTTFLAPQARAKDEPRLACAIAWRVSRLPASVIGTLAHVISAWLQTASPTLDTRCPSALKTLWSNLIAALGATPEAVQSTVVRRKDREPEWVTEALNSPIGRLSQVLMQDPRVTNLQANDEIPQSWLRTVEQLLSLQAPGRQHALAILARNLNWFDARAPKWSEQHLIAMLDSNASDRGAIWAGYFWGATTPAPPLYAKLKTNMKALIESRAVTRHEHVGFLAAMLLDGWQRIEAKGAPRLISDSEIRDMLLKGSDTFRAQAVWYLELWVKGTDERSQAWAQLLPEFLKEVWPRHKDAKTPRTSARLCDLAFSNPQLFPRVADIVTDLVEKVSDQHLILANLQDEDSALMKQYPSQVLALLSAILPEEVSKWPYGLEDILNQLQQSDPSLLKDERLIELRRRWTTG